VVVQGHFRHFRTAEAWLAREELTIAAVGPKCSLGFVSLPLDAASFAELPGLTAFVTCESFLRPVRSYGSCRLGGGWGIEYYFSIVAVQCVADDEAAECLTVEFDGRLLETHWGLADMIDPVWAGVPASGQLRCRVRDGEPPDAEQSAQSDPATR
jgi:hypothetical protein